MLVDPTTFINFRRQDLLREADHERLLAQLQVTPAPSAVRRELALACLRLANWLEAPDHGDHDQYLPPAGSGPADWASGAAAR